MPDSARNATDLAFWGVDSESRNNKLRTKNSTWRELGSLEFLFRHGIQGIIWYDPRSSEKVMRKHTSGRQVVIVDRYLKSFDSIIPEYISGGLALGEYILAQGHRRIGLVSGPQSNYAANMRRRGLPKALKGKAEVIWECDSDFSVTLATRTINHILRRDVSLIACANDQVAVGAMLALRGVGIKVPDDISVTGFDDIQHLCELVEPQLTSVRLPNKTIEDEAVDLVINNRHGAKKSRRHLCLGLEIVARGTVEKCE